MAAEPEPAGDPDGGRAREPQDRREDDAPQDGKPGPLHNPLVLAIGGGVLALAAVGALVFWMHARNFQSTDDAFVDVQIVRIAPQIAGQVTRVMVDDNQRVAPGQPLVSIDSAQVETEVARAEATRAQAESQVDDARAQVSVAQAALEQALADADAARAQAQNARQDLTRFQGLQATNAAAVSQQQLDQAVAQARSTEAQFAAAEKAAKAKARQVTAARTQVASGQEQVRAAQAQLRAAQINLGYAGVAAPVAGTIAQKTVAAGNYVQPGTQLMAVVPLGLWITANFKETQLDRMRPGQPVSIKVDACPRAKVDGHVDSLQRGAGQAFAILPPENATGNFVKVVQRAPVKILIDRVPPDCLLGPGMSVEPSVRVR